MPQKRTQIAEWDYHTVMDNHEPPRRTHRGVLTEWERPETLRENTMVLEPHSPFHKIHTLASGGISFVLDDGDVATPYYVSGWQPLDLTMFLQPFPTNPDKRTRPDGRPIEYSTWVLGPRKTYHLKISKLT